MINFDKETVISWSEVHESLRQFEYKCDHKIDLWDLAERLFYDIEKEEEMIKWLKENANGKVYCNSGFVFHFEEETDLMAFKLRWM